MRAVRKHLPISELHTAEQYFASEQAKNACTAASLHSVARMCNSKKITTLSARYTHVASSPSTRKPARLQQRRSDASSLLRWYETMCSRRTVKKTNSLHSNRCNALSAALDRLCFSVSFGRRMLNHIRALLLDVIPQAQSTQQPQRQENNYAEDPRPEGDH